MTEQNRKSGSRGGLVRPLSAAALDQARAVSNCQTSLLAAISAIVDVESLLRAVDCLLALGVARELITADGRADLSFIIGEYSEQGRIAEDELCAIPCEYLEDE